VDAAPGIDGMTWEAYEADLDRRIEELQRTGQKRSVPGVGRHGGATFRRKTAASGPAGRSPRSKTDRPESGLSAVLSAILRGGFPRVLVWIFGRSAASMTRLDALIVGDQQQKG